MTKQDEARDVANALDAYPVENPVIERAAALLREFAAQPEAPTGNDDCDDCEATRERMADILTRSVNALRGDPPALTMWSWHDLPERITAAMNELRGAMELAAQPAETTRSEKMREAGYTRRPSLREYQKDGDDTEATQPAVATITDAMVVAYLRANDEYWKGTDELPKPPAKWRAGTVKEATRESLKAALNVAEAAQPWQEPPRLTKSQIDFILGDSFLAANGSIYSTRVYDFVRAVEDALAAPVPAQERGELTDSEINTLINDYFLSSGKATSGDMVLRFARAVLAADRPARELATSDPEGHQQAQTDHYADQQAEIERLTRMVRWAYGKLEPFSFSKSHDALMLDEMKLFLEHGV